MNKKLSKNWVKRSLSSVWHPYTQMKHHEQFPLIALSWGEGSWLYDCDNQRYLDAISSWWVNLFGHANPRIGEAIKNQLDTLEHSMLAGFTHKPVVELSEELAKLTGNTLGHVFYASDGSSAVEIALKMSIHFWINSGEKAKTEFICLKNSYHGETIGALSVGDIQLYRDAYQAMIKPVHVVSGPDSRATTNLGDGQEMVKSCLRELEDLLKKRNNHIAGFIVEPLVQGAAGMVMYDSSYIKGVRLLCDKYNIHLLADEIAVGCGRTGTFFACEQAEIWPDFMLLSKGISGGYLPLSLVMTTDKIFDRFYDDDVARGFLHSHTYSGNPLACVAALEVLKIFKDEDVLNKNKMLASSIHQELEWTNYDKRISNARSTGMMFAFDVKYEHMPDHFPRRVFETAGKNELLLRPIGNVVYMVPPYTLRKSEIDHLSSSVKKTLDDVLV